MVDPAHDEAPLCRVRVEVAREQTEAVESALVSLGALSVTLCDAGDEALLEATPGEAPLWGRVRVEALFQALPASPRLDAALRGTLGRPCPWEAAPVETRDWVRETQALFPARRFGRRLWVCPSWTEPPRDGTVLRLDPGLAFGTGTHPTTALCLEWLDAHPPAGLTVVDYGCGSGVLGIAAALLGARRVYATDIDPQALEATRDNARRNGLPAERLTAVAPEALAGLRAERVLANILQGPLLDLRPVLAALTAPGARLVLSGLLAGQAGPLRAAYGAEFEFTGERRQGDWILLEARRR